MDQVVGYCDGNTSLPNEFRFTAEDKKGNKEVKYYSKGPDGQLMEINHKKRGEAKLAQRAKKNTTE